MEKLILVFHVLTALAIIGLILLQQGKGAEMGASFGAGASQTVFGSQGGGNFFTRATAILAALFFATSFGLAIVAKQQSEISVDAGIPVTAEQADIPALVEEQASDLPLAEDVNGAAGDLPVVEEASESQ
jgi:preprotein translocase subunit SecG